MTLKRFIDFLLFFELLILNNNAKELLINLISNILKNVKNYFSKT